MLSLGWILYLFLISLVIALLTLVILFRKAKSDDSTPASKKVRLIKQLLPSTDQLKGWSLYTVDNGLRVWHKKFDSNTSPWLQGKIFTCSGIIPATQREVMNVLQQAEMSTQWDPEIQQVHNINSRGNKSDVVCVSTNCQGLLAKTVHYVQGLFGGQTSTVYSRYWDVNNKSEAWMFSSFIKEVVPLDGVLWSCFLLSTLDQNDEDEPPECLLTLVIAPVSSSFACIPRLTSSRVAGLQDYFTQSRPSAPLEKPTVSFNANNLLGNSAAPSAGIKPEEEINLQGENTVAKESPSLGMIEREGIEELKQKLIGVYQATAGVDGWTLIGNIKDVEILKRSSRTGERPWDCLKGTSIVRVPVHYILAYIFSLDYRGEWDDLFVKGETVEEYDPLTKVNRLEYKPLWPASGRDFCTFVVVRELSEGLYGLASEAVEHEDCPERKGIVRGEIIIGGFVVKELSSDPPSCQVTYMTRVDLKGNLPARIVNRATQSQPQAVAVLRERLEALYKEDVDSQNGKTSKLQQEAVELWVNLMKVKEAKEARVQASGGTPVLSERDDGEAAEEKMSVSECSLTEMSECDSLSLPPDVKEEESQMQPPLDGCLHHLDYKTLANQTIANLVGEILLASKVEISMPEELTYSPRTKDGEWSYQSIEKDVVILRKISQGEKIHSFLGKGIIKVQPPAVWQAVRNHMNRHMYDRMLKKTTLVKQIDDETKILYLHHETTQCFVKQSRDFVVLTADRVEAEKYVIAATSVDIPQLPPSKDIVRGTIYATGWVIEPVLQHGQLFSMVSYLSQVDFGGALPTRLVNLIARRQPLCVSYLRNYLEKLKE